MKKLLSLILIFGITVGASAQDKKFQIGLVLGPTFNWTKIQTTKIEKNGIGTGFTIGVGGNYMFNENVGIASGIQFDLESSKLNYGSSTNSSLGDIYYGYSDTDIEKFKDGAIEEFANDTAATAYRLTTRKFRAKYITIPFFLKFQTNMIGKFKYYGKFGLRTSILAAIRMDDEGHDATYNGTLATPTFTDNAVNTYPNRTDMKPVGLKKGLSPVRMGIGIYGGAEWNFTGSTFLYWEAGFNYGITPQLYPESGHLAERQEDGSFINLDIKNNPQHIIEIKMGLLF